MTNPDKVAEIRALPEDVQWIQDYLDGGSDDNLLSHARGQRIFNSLKALDEERECVWTKYDADDCEFENCWATSCGEDFSIVEEWHEDPTPHCSNCGGKVRLEDV